MLSPPLSPVTGSSDSERSQPMGDQRALEKLALELSMLDLNNPSSADGLSHNSADLAVALLNIQQHQQQQHSPAEGLVPGSTLNAFTSMLGFSPVAGAHFDDRSKKSANMTECVPVPSSEHVAEIVGRQGEFEAMCGVRKPRKRHKYEHFDVCKIVFVARDRLNPSHLLAFLYSIKTPSLQSNTFASLHFAFSSRSDAFFFNVFWDQFCSWLSGWQDVCVPFFGWGWFVGNVTSTMKFRIVTKLHFSLI